MSKIVSSKGTANGKSVARVRSMTKHSGFVKGFAQGLGAIGGMFRQTSHTKIHSQRITIGSNGLVKNQRAIGRDMHKSVKVVTREFG